MKKNVWLIICLLLSLMAYSPETTAQTAPKLFEPQALYTIRFERERFVRYFYTSYMGSIVYRVDGLDEILREKYVKRALLKRKTGADVLLDAQDCIEENLKTLNVEAIDDDWYRVSFLWPSAYPAIPPRRHVILVKVDGIKNSSKIVDIKVEH